MRTLAAHTYRNPGDQAMDFSEQYLYSVNVPGNLFITALWAPVGLLYHDLGKAQHLLVHGLSDNEFYLETLRNSLWDALWRIWNEAKIASQ